MAKQQKKKAYVAPRVMDFGAIEVMTGDCLGLCTDGFHGAFWGIWPPPEGLSWHRGRRSR